MIFLNKFRIFFYKKERIFETGSLYRSHAYYKTGINVNIDLSRPIQSRPWW